MDDYLRYAAIVALVLLALWLVGKIFYYFINIISPKHDIVFVTDAQADVKSKQAPQILSAKLRRLQSYAKQPPTGYGFLQLPALGAIPQEAQKQLETLGDLKNISIKIKDVDVNAIIKAVSEVLSPPHYELRVHTIDLPDATEVSCDLFYGDKQEANWRSRARKVKKEAGESGGDNAPARAGNRANANDAEAPPDVDRLLDDVLFQLIYDFMTKEEFKGWGIKMTQSDYRPQNWQTLQAYTRGVQALTAYQQNLDNRDLNEALSFLERLPIVAPNNAYGLYYYGLALSENRQEDEAVATFEQLQRLLTDNPESPLSVPTGITLQSPSSSPPVASTSPAQPSPKAGAEKMYYEAKFNEATARLKFYRLQPGEQAAQTLTQLISELEKKTGKKEENEERWYYSKLLAISYAQLAYTHGTLLSMMHDQNLPRMTDIPAEIKTKWGIIEDNLKKADKEFRVNLKACWEQEKETPEDQAQLMREKGDIEFRIENAAGYSLFRLAQYWAEIGDKESQALRDQGMQKFRELCKEAISHLEQANLARPNHYEVLQNMAMIYEDRVYDPDGIYLEKAESLYLQTKKFVPNDYYQYEHLAVIQWRRIELAAPASRPDLIKAGKDYALQALELRPHATTALYTLARFNIKTWENAKDKTTADAKNAAAEAISYLKQALAVRPESRTFLSEYVGFLLKVSNPNPTDANVAVEDGSTLLDLAKKEGVEEEQKKNLLQLAVKMFAKAMELTKAKDTDEKRLINEKAQALKGEAEKLLTPPSTGGAPASSEGAAASSEGGAAAAAPPTPPPTQE